MTVIISGDKSDGYLKMSLMFNSVLQKLLKCFLAPSLLSL